MTNKSQIDPEHLSFNSLRILRFCHLNMFKERHTDTNPFRISDQLNDRFSVSILVLLFLKAGAKIGTIISSMQAFGQKNLKKLKDFF